MKLIRFIYFVFLTFGIDFRKMVNMIRGLPWYVSDYRKFKSQNKNGHGFSRVEFLPALNEKYQAAGEVKGHYFHQDLLVAQKIFDNNPAVHIDIGSRLDGFVAHVASFRKITVLDVRDLKQTTENIYFQQLDLMEDPSIDWLESCDSLSCLHALEHFGLGRYSDPINYDGHIVGLKNMIQLLKPGGVLYLSVPIGLQRIVFNAHRVFSVGYVVNLLKEDFDLESFSYVDDNGDLHKNIPLDEIDLENSFDCTYGCGIFEFIKNK